MADRKESLFYTVLILLKMEADDAFNMVPLFTYLCINPSGWRGWQRKESLFYTVLILLKMQADDAFNMVLLFYKNYLFMYQSKWRTWLTKTVYTVYKQIWVKGANWRVIHLLNCFFTKPHCYGVFTYTVIENNFYDSVFLMYVPLCYEAFNLPLTHKDRTIMWSLCTFPKY